MKQPVHLTENTRRAEARDAADEALLRAIIFLEPDRMVQPPSWIAHIPFAFWIVDILRPRVFVELGTHSGNSYAALAQAAQHVGLDAAGYAIDTWKGDAQAGFYGESVYEEFKAYHDSRYSAFSTLIRSTFDDAAAHFSEGSIDLLNIDGYHSAEAVTHDFETWHPRMSERGVVLMHDINVRERDFGAWQTWERLKHVYPSFEFHHGHGLGVLCVGRDLPPEVMWLSSASTQPARVNAIRQLFAKTGAALLNRFETGEAHTDASATRLAAEIDARDATIVDLSARLETAAERAADDRRAQVELEAQISALDGRLAQARTELDAEVSEAAASLSSRTEEAEQLRAELRETQAGFGELVKDLAWHRDTKRIQEVVTGLAIGGAADAAAQVEALRARVSFLAHSLAAAPRVLPSKLGRIWGTLQSLGVTPSDVIRRPRRLATALRLATRPRALAEAHLIAQSGAFDAGYYGRRYPEVLRSSLTPLAHFVLAGARERRSPHVLFDSDWYLRHYPDVAGSGVNPLVHYLRAVRGEARDPHPLFSVTHYRAQVAGPGAPPFEPLQHYTISGALQGYSPHPLFDPRYYVETFGGAAACADPLAHFIEAGAAEGFSPHPLFDVAWYRSQAPDAQSHNPLIHYLEAGHQEGLQPHPLFDPAYYLATQKDVAASRAEPLTHFVVAGGLEGRRPIREFDTAWYLSAYADVAASRMNPLAHFVRHGWREHRNPSPHFDTIGYLARYADVAAAGANPLTHYVQHGRAEGRLIGPFERPERHIESEHRAPLRAARLDGLLPRSRVVVCVTHVMPTSPRAGNEYRVQRVLRWLRDSGYVVVPVVGPIRDHHPTTAEIRAVADEYGNAVVCQTDGRVEYILRDLPDVLGSLEGKYSARWATPLGEDLIATERERELLRIDRSFCTDVLIDTVMRLQTALGPYVLLAEYIWMSRLLPLLDSRALKIIDTIDVFSTRAEKVHRYGVDDLTISPDEERVRLERADLIIAIQENERAALEALAPSVPVITSGVDFDVVAEPGTPGGDIVLCVASGNPMNRRGLQDFLRFAWPRVRELVPGAELVVAGAAGESIALPPPGVTILGAVAELAPLYAACRVVINPAVAGTGVKIKTLEALSFLRPIVTWPNGVDGISADLAALCRPVDDWHGFAHEVVDILRRGARSTFTAADRETLERESRPERVYAELGGALRDFFDRHDPRASQPNEPTRP